VLRRVAVTSKYIAEELGHLNQLRVLDVSVALYNAETDDDEWTACREALLESLGKLTKVECLRIRGPSPINLDGSMAEGNLRWLSLVTSSWWPHGLGLRRMATIRECCR
jgi:hypothetical protein